MENTADKKKIRFSIFLLNRGKVLPVRKSFFFIFFIFFVDTVLPKLFILCRECHLSLTV